MRVGSQIAAVLEPHLRKSGRPYGLEVVGDPHETFAPGAVRHPLRPFFRWSFSRRLKQQCRHASGVAYVTEKALQERYPPRRAAFTTHYSSIHLQSSAVVAAPRTVNNSKQSFTLVTVGSLAQLYKAPDVLIAAVADCIKGGLDLRLVIIGDGRHRAELQALAESSGVGERVVFAGQLPAGESVRAALDAADLFVLPSRTEGLPRAMIEAMARALPCVGSTAGGIPELLAPEDMVAPNDRRALAEKIREVITDPVRLSAISARNLRKAAEYRDEDLSERRTEFYRRLRVETEKWLEGNN
jgi:glycosyltransferase involved in cell wall biosynthesis